MLVVLRVDASYDIGSGHVVRCLALADALRECGAICVFICRAHHGNLLEFIQHRGYQTHSLPLVEDQNASLIAHSSSLPTHSHLLGAHWVVDAQQTLAALGGKVADYLVVDHYAIDAEWERFMRLACHRLMVIDDLADRAHLCDFLLDQNLGRHSKDYASLVSAVSRVLAGPQYALLRPEFAALRAYSLNRRQRPELKQVLITMGGVDQPNATGQVLEALKSCTLPEDCRISVVMGLQAPWLPQVRTKSKDMPWQTEVLVNISNMAQRMADSDLAIGAAGSTSWERCCLGLPTLLVVLADNQWLGALALKEAQAALLIGGVNDIEMKLPLAINASASHLCLQEISSATSAITDGLGVKRVLNAIGVLND
jgi:UDP-2,4-diacetamido-2,4,6-trideoxy-beta-L-altropyranose hydrolase